MTIAYDILTATVAATMAGNEFAIAAFVHPQLRRSADNVHAPAAAALAKSLGTWMPLWYGAGLLLIVGAAFEHRPVVRGPGLLVACAGVLWAAAILFTISLLVPINNRIAKLNPIQPYAGWLEDRARWDRLHRLRVALLLVAVVLLLAGLLTGAAVS